MSSSSINYFTEKARLLAHRDFETNADEAIEIDFRMSIPFRTSMETHSAAKELNRMQSVYASDLKQIKAFNVESGLNEDGSRTQTIEASESVLANIGSKRKRSPAEDETLKIKHNTSIMSFTEKLNTISIRYNGSESIILPPAAFKHNREQHKKHQDAATDAITHVENTRVPMADYIQQRERLFKTKIRLIYRAWGFIMPGSRRWRPPLQPKNPEESPVFGKKKETSMELIKRFTDCLPILEPVPCYFEDRPKIKYLDAVASAVHAYAKAIENEHKKRSFTQEEFDQCKPHLKSPKKMAVVQKRRVENKDWKAWNDAKKAAVSATEATDTQREIVRVIKAVHDALPDQLPPTNIGTLISLPMRMRTRMGKDKSERKYGFTGSVIKSDMVSLEKHSKTVGHSPLSNVVAGAGAAGK